MPILPHMYHRAEAPELLDKPLRASRFLLTTFLSEKTHSKQCPTEIWGLGVPEAWIEWSLWVPEQRAFQTHFLFEP
jgi:hypothetical protein